MALAAVFFLLSIVFVYRSFYKMRIEESARPAGEVEEERRAQEA
jgi:hypothetical protein